MLRWKFIFQFNCLLSHGKIPENNYECSRKIHSEIVGRYQLKPHGHYVSFMSIYTDIEQSLGSKVVWILKILFELVAPRRKPPADMTHTGMTCLRLPNIAQAPPTPASHQPAARTTSWHNTNKAGDPVLTKCMRSELGRETPHAGAWEFSTTTHIGFIQGPIPHTR